MRTVNVIWKSTFIVILALALALSGLGLIRSVQASDEAPAAPAARQEAGGAWLGVAVDDTADGALIVDVYPGSPADDAELLAGEIITRLDDTVIDSVDTLVATLETYAPGDEVTVTVLSDDGEEREVPVTLGERPADLDEPPAPGGEGEPFQLFTLNLLGLDLTLVEDGLRVNSIDADSPLADSGLQAGDLITSIGGLSVENLSDPRELMLLLQEGDALEVVIERDGEEQTLTIDLPGFGDIEMPEEFGFNFGMMGDHPMFSALGVEVSWTDEGLRIDALEADSPLADAGFEEGDVVTAIDGTALGDLDLDAMMAIMSAFADDQVVTVTVLRDGEEQEIELDLSELDLSGISMMPMMPGVISQGTMMQPPSQLGVQFRLLTADIAEEEGIDTQEGALIEQVYDDTPAAEAGLQDGDVVTGVNGEPVDEEHTLADRLYAYEEGDTVTLSVLRDGEEQEIDVTLGPNPRDTQFRFEFGPGHMIPFDSGRSGSYRGAIPRFKMPGRGMDEFFRHHPFMAPPFDSQGEDEAEPERSSPSALLGQAA